MDVNRRTSEGFAAGEVMMEGLGSMWGGRSLRVTFQNENLAAWESERLLACVPDLICCLETGSAYPSANVFRF